MITAILRVLSSLKLAIFSLVGLFIIVLAGTLLQIEYGLYYTQNLVFYSWMIWVDIAEGIRVPVFPGGLFFGSLLGINLAVVSIKKHYFSWKKGGILLIHWGLVVLLLGAVIQLAITQESMMRLVQNEPQFYSESQRELELVLIDTSHSDTDTEFSILFSELSQGDTVSLGPVDIQVKKRAIHSEMKPYTPEPDHARRGVARRWQFESRPIPKGDDVAYFSALELDVFQNDKSLGTWVVSLEVPQVQPLDYASDDLLIQIRPKRWYNPYSLTLEKFQNEQYLGTTVPKHYASTIHLENPITQENRQILVYMNHPLRYLGKTYYQASFEPSETVSILQVAQNPIWSVPYIASLIMSLGLIWQFGVGFYGFFKKGRRK